MNIDTSFAVQLFNSLSFREKLNGVEKFYFVNLNETYVYPFRHPEWSEAESKDLDNCRTLMKQSAIYILTNHSNKVLYTGVTSDLIARTWQHKKKLVKGFTSKYSLYKLVYYEIYENIEDAIKREKQIKKWRREKKTKLINKLNPDWSDLYKNIIK